MRRLYAKDQSVRLVESEQIRKTVLHSTVASHRIDRSQSGSLSKADSEVFLGSR